MKLRHLPYILIPVLSLGLYLADHYEQKRRTDPWVLVDAFYAEVLASPDKHPEYVVKWVTEMDTHRGRLWWTRRPVNPRVDGNVPIYKQLRQNGTDEVTMRKVIASGKAVRELVLTLKDAGLQEEEWKKLNRDYSEYYREYTGTSNIGKDGPRYYLIADPAAPLRR